MCWFCDDIKKFVNKNIVVYDDTTANVIKEYSYPGSTVTLKITAGGYRGNSNILTGMRALNGLRYCPNCGEKIEDSDACTSKENDKISCEDDILIGDNDLLTESYIENKRKLYKRLKADIIWIKYLLDNCSFDPHDVDINLSALRSVERKISEIEDSAIFKYIKED